MTDSRSKLMGTVEKLLAKASGTTNANEAAAFLEKATQMMNDAGLTQQDLDRSQVVDTEVKSRQSVSKPKAWEMHLVKSVAASFGCGVLWSPGHSNFVDYWGRYTLVGSRDYLKLAEYAVVTLLRQAAKARAQRSLELSKFVTLDRKTKNQQLESYINGWVQTVADKAKVFAVETNTELKGFVDDHLKALATGTVKTKQVKVSAAAFQAGLDAGKAVELQRPMEGGEARLQVTQQ